MPRTVVLLGLTSFFADVGSEMIFPLLPVFVASLGAGPAFLGLVEGIADAVASLLKLASGYVADRTRRRKPLVLLGYALAGIARPLMGAAAAPWHVLAIRGGDRVGKGLRAAPRDVLIAAAAPVGQAGRAFGFHRAMDHAGAVLGPLVATAALALGASLRTVFFAAVVPSLASVLCVALVREGGEPRPPSTRAERSPGPSPSTRRRGALPGRLRSYLLILFVFALGNSSDAFLLLRAKDLGVAVSALPLLWVALHVSKLSFSYLGGVLSDRMPRARLVLCGWAVYAVTYLALGFADRAWHVWVLFVVYGVHSGLTEPVEKAIVKDLTSDEIRGRAFGLYNFVVGASAIPAGVLTGVLWQAHGPRVALAVGAALSAFAAVLIAVWERTGGAQASDTARTA